MPRLVISLLGPKQIRLDGEPVSAFTYNKAVALLAYLAVEVGSPHSRQTLVGLLWPDLPTAAALTNLRQALADLRRVIADAAAAPPFLLITRESIQFNAQSDYELDATTFLSTLAQCEAHRHRHIDRCRACQARLQAAMALYRGDYDQVVVLAARALEAARRAEATWEMASALFYMGDALYLQDRLEEANAKYTASLQLSQAVGNRRSTGRRLARLGQVACRQGELALALRLSRQALTLCAECRDLPGTAMAILVMINVAIGHGDYPRAATLLGATEQIFETSPVIRNYPLDRREHRQALAVLSERLAPDRFDVLWASGRALSSEQMVALAQSDPA